MSSFRIVSGRGAQAQGLRIYTTFDPRLQQAAYDAIGEVLDTPDAPWLRWCPSTI
ncbi:MAG: hypothetical protein M5U19_01075 [Microthrixaceae bacterium]|nr:hypothetical protein [Microthrixaceae bacterium]